MSIEPLNNYNLEESNISSSPINHPVTQEEFNNTYHYVEISETGLYRKWKKQISSVNVKSCLFYLLPVLRWLPTYRWKQNLLDDFVAGLTVAVMHVPQGLAYSSLGAVPPAVGLYTAIFPVLVYILYASSRHVNMGTFAVVSMMASKSVIFYSVPQASNSTESQPLKPTPLPSYSPIEVSAVLCLVVGIWQVVFSVLRLGSLTVIMSQTLISGFTTAAAVMVFTSQMRHVFGIKLPYHYGPLKLIYTYIDLISMIKQTNYVALIMTLCVVVVLLFVQYIKPILTKKTRFPFPMEITIVVLGTLISQHFQFSEVFDVSVIGYIPSGLPEPSLPPLPLVTNVLVDSLVIAIVAFSINISMSSIFALKDNYKVDANQELLACGLGNVVGSLFSCLPMSASLTRSLIQYNVGGKTQLASFVSCCLMIQVLLFIGPYFERLPHCVLAGLIIIALKNMFMQVKDLPMIWRHNQQDGIIWLLTFFSVILVDIEVGLGVGIIASLISIILMSQNILISQLGNLPNTSLYLDMDRYDMAETVPHTIIIQINGGLHFANNNFLRTKIKKLLKEKLRHETKQEINKCIIDMSAVTFVDPASCQVLLNLADDLEKVNISLCLAKCSVHLLDQLRKSEFFESFSESKLFPNVHNAVLYNPDTERL